jgi:hypothetical protein
MCLKEKYSEVHIGKHLSNNFPIQNELKQGDALSPFLFNFALKYAIRNLQENKVGLKLNGAHQFLAYANNLENKEPADTWDCTFSSKIHEPTMLCVHAIVIMKPDKYF